MSHVARTQPIWRSDSAGLSHWPIKSISHSARREPRHRAMLRAVDHQLTLDNPLGEPGALHRRRVGDAGSHYLITFTMWAMTSAAMRRAIADCSIMVILAHRLVGNVSVGLNAVALVNARYR